MEEFYNETQLEESREKLTKSKEYLEKGYEYPAANNAFLALLNLKTLKDQHYGTEWSGIYEKTQETREIPDYGAPLHYTIGAQERYSWAQNVGTFLEAEPEEVNSSYYNGNLVLVWLEVTDRFMEEVEEERLVFSSEIVKKADEWEERAGEEIAGCEGLGLDTYGAPTILNAVDVERGYGWYYAAVYDSINAAGRAGSVHANEYETVQLMKKAEGTLEKAKRHDLGFWAEQYLENSMVAFSEGNTREAYAYAFMADEYARFDMYAAGIPLVEELPEPVSLIRTPDLPEVGSFWDGICEILGRWCWRKR